LGFGGAFTGVCNFLKNYQHALIIFLFKFTLHFFLDAAGINIGKLSILAQQRLIKYNHQYCTLYNHSECYIVFTSHSELIIVQRVLNMGLQGFRWLVPISPRTRTHTMIFLVMLL